MIKLKKEKISKNGKPPREDTLLRGGDFYRLMYCLADAKEARRLVIAQAELTWDAENGAWVETKKLEVKEFEELYEKSTTVLLALEEKKRNTSPYIKSFQLHGDGDDKKISFSAWRMKDKIVLCSSLSAAVVTLATGSANVFSNIQSAGDVIFLDNPLLALLLAFLLPAGSVALKFIADYFENDRTRRLYILIMYGLTVLMLLLWTVLFALNFHGMTGGVDWEQFGETNHASTAFTWIQLATEMLVGSALFQVASDTYSRYSPDTYFHNPEYIEIVNRIKDHMPGHELLREKRNNARAELVELQAKRQAYVNEQEAKFLATRSRFDASSPN